MIQGGEEFIWAAYGISWVALALYTLSLFTRLKRAHAERDAQALEGETT